MTTPAKFEPARPIKVGRAESAYTVARARFSACPESTPRRNLTET